MKRFCLLVTLLCCGYLSAQTKFSPSCSTGKTLHFPSAHTTPIDDECGLPGTPPATAPEDGLQNEAKNNFCADSGAAKKTTLAEITSLQGKAQTQEAALHFTPGTAPKSRAFLEALGEGDQVVFEGFVFAARQECKETVNCELIPANVNASHDIHISLLEKPRKTAHNSAKANQDKEECTGFVAEMIPHHRPPEWTSCNVNDVAGKGLRVRVTGQRFFDGSHLACKNGLPQGSNPKRVSLWEIHPIYSFEVCPHGDCANGGWEPLEKFAAGKASCPENEECTKPKPTPPKKTSTRKKGTGSHGKS